MKNNPRIPKKEIEIRKDLALKADPLQTLRGSCDQRKVEVLYYQKNNEKVVEWLKDEIDKHKNKKKHKDFFDDNTTWEDFRNVVCGYLYSTVFPNFIKAGKYMKEGRFRGYLRDTINTQFKNFRKKEGRALPKEDRDDYDEEGTMARGRKKLFWEEDSPEKLLPDRKDIRNFPGLAGDDQIYMSLRMDGFFNTECAPYFGGINKVRGMQAKLRKNKEFKGFLREKANDEHKPYRKPSKKRQTPKQADKNTKCSCSKANCKKYDPKKCILDTRTNRYTYVR